MLVLLMFPVLLAFGAVSAGCSSDLAVGKILAEDLHYVVQVSRSEERRTYCRWRESACRLSRCAGMVPTCHGK